MKIEIKPYTKGQIFKLLNALPHKTVREAMHKVQGEHRKRKKVLLPTEVKEILIELGCENMIKKESESDPN